MVLLIMKSRFEKWLAIIGNINPTFSVTNPVSSFIRDHGNIGKLSCQWGAPAIPGIFDDFPAPAARDYHSEEGDGCMDTTGGTWWYLMDTDGHACFVCLWFLYGIIWVKIR